MVFPHVILLGHGRDAVKRREKGGKEASDTNRTNFIVATTTAMKKKMHVKRPSKQAVRDHFALQSLLTECTALNHVAYAGSQMRLYDTRERQGEGSTKGGSLSCGCVRNQVTNDNLTVKD